MDTVSMLNKMSFYCQPILPLVYDESMSYYETLCKVVGQLNTTGETVNKLNEGLTGEIADRQTADSLLNERLKVVEATNKKIHCLVFAGTPPHKAGLIGTAPTRSELRQWVNNNDLIITLLYTTDGERKSVYAASCAYNAGNWSDESSDDFNILVPIHTSYDADNDHAISQKVAKITIPPASAPSLDGDWGLQFIEINTPSTSADGVVNFAANIFEDGHMECNLTPNEFAQLYAPTWANRNLCVAVNAKLFYDGYTRTSSVATINSTNHLIRIAFERDYETYIENGVNQFNKTTDFIIGNVSTNTWTHESIDSKVFDLPRYVGFQFTRGAHNVITADDESTPNAVYTQYQANSSGKLYQNLPTRLIDTVDNAEYWNGVFDIKDGNHMTFTFVASNYAAASDKMLVRVIELSANVNTTAWKYAEKEFELPITGLFTVDDALSDTSTNPVQNKVVKAALDGKASTAVASRTANGLMSTSDYIKLLGIEDGANKTIVDELLSDESTNPVQNKTVTAALATVVREAIYPITVTATSTDWVVNNGIAYKEATADRTFDNIKAAYNANKTPVCEFAGITYSLILSSTTEFVFASYRGAVANDTQYAGLGKYPTSLITITTTGEVISRTAGDLPAVGGTDNGKMLIVSGGEWALQRVPGATVDAELSTTSENPVQNKTVTASLNSKLPKTGGTVTGALRTNDSFSAGGTISFGEAPIGLSQTADGAAQIRYGSADVNDNPPPLSRLKVARPTADDDAATKKYVDDRNDSPQFKGYVTLTPANETIGLGVGLYPSKDGNNYALDISDVNADEPTLLTGVKTPTDADTNAAATVEYVLNKAASGGSSDFVVNATINSDRTVTLDKTFTQIREAALGGKSVLMSAVSGGSHFYFPLITVAQNICIFEASFGNEGSLEVQSIRVTSDNVVTPLMFSAPVLNSDGTLPQFPMASDPTSPMQIATKQYVDTHVSGAPITIKLGTGNAATSTATFAEIKAALEAGKAPILNSAPGTSHWFALNWTLSGTDRLTIQYGTFDVDGGGLANFTLYNVTVSSTGITYSSSQFTTE